MIALPPLDYWLETLKDCQTGTHFDIRMDSRSPSTALTFTLDGAAGLNTVGEHLGIARATLMIGALFVLLRRYTQSTSIVVNVNLQGRVLPIAMQLSDSLSARSMLLNLQQRLQSATAHAAFFDEAGAQQQLLARLGCEQTGFSDFSIACDTSAVNVVARHGFLFQIEGEHLLIHYPAGVEPGFIVRLAANFQQTLHSLLQSPELAVDQLPVISTAELRTMLHDWNATSRHYPGGELTLTELFSRQCQRNPDHIALMFGKRQISYAELDRASNRLAHRLLAMGVETGNLIGLRMQRSIEMVVALVAIIKSGCAYVPLDPSHPLPRLTDIVASSGLRIVLTQPALHHADLAVRQIDLPDQLHWIAPDQPNNTPHVALHPDLPAYVIYTSGSTGKPKGVLIAHRAIVNRILWMQAEYHLRSSDRVLQKTPYTFDVSVWEFFWPLLHGATLVIAAPEGHKDPRYLAAAIVEHGVNVLHFVPSMLRIFLQFYDTQQVALTGKVFCSGEVLPLDLKDQFLQAFPLCELHNLYGPTEAAVDVSYWNCRDPISVPSVPIGRPIANIQLYILDPARQPVPLGMPGELYIGGVGLAAGYLNNPQQTAASFIASPWPEKGPLLYKTGDLAHHLEDGNIAYLSRVDFQVKIRGVRIELGEIEYRLQTCPALSQSVVVARETAPNNMTLIAYYTLKPGAKITPQALADVLRVHLPEAMLPSHFVQLDAMPLNPSGKIDRKQLPRPSLSNEAHATLCVQNGITPRQAEVVHLLQEIMPTGAAIGLDDDVIALGGNSLNSVHLSMRIERQYGLRFTVEDVLLARTARRIAARIECKLSADDDWTTVLEIQTEGKQTPLFMIHSGWGLALPYLALSEHFPQRPVYGISNPFFGMPEASFTSLPEMAAHYVELMRAIQPQGPYLLGGWCFGGLVAYEMAIQLEAAGEQVHAVILFNTFNASIYDLTTTTPAAIAKSLARDKVDSGSPEGQRLSRELLHNTKLMMDYTPGACRSPVALVRAQLAGESNYTKQYCHFYHWDRYCPHIQVYSLPLEHNDFFRAEHAPHSAALIETMVAQAEQREETRTC